MKKVLLLTCLPLTVFFARAQFVNNGATVTVQTGATIFCNGDFTNTSGTITNDGKIEVQGNFINSGTYNSTTLDDSLLLTGSGNVTVNSGGATFRYLTINKGSNSDIVTLAASMNIANKLDFLVGSLTTDYLANPSYAVIAPTSAVFNFGAGREIAGNVTRTGWANGSAVLFNSAFAQLTTNGGTAPTQMMMTMLPHAFGGDPSQAEREVKRKFLFTPAGGSGFTTDIQFPYSDVPAELSSNVEGNLVPWHLVTAEWNAILSPVSRNAANNWVSTTGVNTTNLAQEWKLADPRYTFNITAYLRGPWTSGPNMTTNINSILPLTQPYNVSPFNYAGAESVGSIPNTNIVDWVLVELRKPSSGLPTDATASTVIGRKAGFLLNTGVVVDLDGSTPIAFDISKQGSSFVVVRHRNHLGVLSNSIPSNALGTFANDYSALANSYKDPGSPTDPVVLLPSSTKYALWAGDATSPSKGVVNITDVNTIKIAIAASASGYLDTDVNLSNGINAADFNASKITISASGTGSLPARIATGKVKSNLPDKVDE